MSRTTSPQINPLICSGSDYTHVSQPAIQNVRQQNHHMLLFQPWVFNQWLSSEGIPLSFHEKLVEFQN